MIVATADVTKPYRLVAEQATLIELVEHHLRVDQRLLARIVGALGISKLLESDQAVAELLARWIHHAAGTDQLVGILKRVLEGHEAAHGQVVPPRSGGTDRGIAPG